MTNGSLSVDLGRRGVLSPGGTRMRVRCLARRDCYPKALLSPAWEHPFSSQLAPLDSIDRGQSHGDPIGRRQQDRHHPAAPAHSGASAFPPRTHRHVPGPRTSVVARPLASTRPPCTALRSKPIIGRMAGPTTCETARDGAPGISRIVHTVPGFLCGEAAYSTQTLYSLDASRGSVLAQG